MPAASAAADRDDARYTLAGGCYALGSQGRFAVKQDATYRVSATAASTAEPFHMQATSLGHYLLFGKASDHLAASGDGKTAPAAVASGAAEWRVDSAGQKKFTLINPETGKALAVAPDGTLVTAEKGAAGRFAFTRTGGCAAFPEAEVNATGAPSKGATPYAEVRGFVDPHFHGMAFEFLGGRARCGRPWHPYGVTHAMVDCPDHEPNGEGAVLENFLTNGTPYGTHDTVGWPTFKDWPRHDSLTHEAAYYKGIERSWRGGLRLVTNLLVDNAVLCEIYPYKSHGCNEMDTVRLELKRIRELEDYIDAQSGGPGKGWFRIVTDPFQARRVINAGKLAVILGVENSKLFDCGLYNDVSECDRAMIDRELAEFYGAGVRQMELMNKFDNAFSGVAGDAGALGVAINNANKYETGNYWAMQTCNHGDEHVHDQPQETLPGGGDVLAAGILELFLPPGTTPIYGPPPHCNARGLRPEGEYLITEMMERGMIFDPDHMSVLGRQQAMKIIEDARYSGVISSHSWSTPDVYPAIYRLGGMITPVATESKQLVKDWRQLKALHDPRFEFGFGFGSDVNGFHRQGGPRDDAAKRPLSYPFKSFDGAVTLDRQRWGERVWDLNVDGVAQYGMYPDWVEDARIVAGDEIVQDLARGAEAYLQMWERTNGIPAGGCLPAGGSLTRKGRGAVRVGLGPEALLRAAGQPAARAGRAFRWCVGGKANVKKRLAAVFTAQETVGLVASNARTHRARSLAPGARASRLRKLRARRLSKSLYTRNAGRGAKFVYGVRKGRVRYVAVAARSVARSPKRLREYQALGRTLGTLACPTAPACRRRSS